MAMVLEPQDVEVASGDEIDAAIARELADLGLSYDELRDQADRDDFVSDEAERVWFMISPLGS